MADSHDPSNPDRLTQLVDDSVDGEGSRSAAARAESPAPPVAERRPHVTRLHGVELSDPYHWLRDRDDPAVRSYLEAENAYTEAMTAATAELEKDLYRELLSHVQEADRSVPHRRGDHLYYSRTEPGREYPVHCRRLAPRGAGGGAHVKPGEEGPEEVLLDLDRMAEGRAFLRLGSYNPSPDGPPSAPPPGAPVRRRGGEGSGADSIRPARCPSAPVSRAGRARLPRRSSGPRRPP
jgi:hypothetical protein